MNPNDIAQITQIASTINPNDPLSGTLNVILIVIAVLMAAWPLMQLFRKWNSDKSANTKDTAESFLYEHLQEQIARNHKELKETREENETLRKTIHNLEARIGKLEIAENTIEKLKSKLDLKDEIISKRDKDIDVRDAMLSQREMKIHEMFDIVLTKDKEIGDLKMRVLILEGADTHGL